jgi:cell division protein FtsI (penicillin-binding protein 3)
LSTAKKKNKVNSRRAILLRAYFVFGIALLFGLAVLVSAARLQLRSDSEFSALLRQKTTREIHVKAIRGNIYADDESLLATSVPTYNLIFDSRADGLTNDIFRNKIDSFCRNLAAMFPERSAAEWRSYFQRLRDRKIRYAVIHKDLNFLQVKSIKKWPLVNMGKFTGGFWWEEQAKRLYFMGELAKRAIGYSKQGVYVGLEGAFDSLLSGADGKRLEQRMPGNVWRPIQTGNYTDPVNGYDIVTTLDVNLQDVAQSALDRVLTENEADHGCAVVMEVATGQIKAIANLKRTKDGKYSETQNYAVDEFSEPGSTFKLISTMALLEDGYCKPGDSVNVEGGKTKFYGQNMVDASKPHKNIHSLQECFEKSSNVGISKLIVKHYTSNPQKFIDHSLDLGLNIKPDFDIRSAGNPRIKTKKSADWSAVSLPWMSIGYELKISPMQVLMLYNAVANNGRMVKPYLVREIRQEGRLIKRIEPTVIKEKICSDETIKALKVMMEGVVDHGTATNLKNPDYKVAGKTGTAQISKGGGYDKSSYKASFVGYFPAENPQYTVIVVINEPRKGIYYGALVAGPVFKEIADKIYSSSVSLHPGVQIAGTPAIPQMLHGNLNKSKTVLNGLGVSSAMDSSGKQGAWVKAKPGTFALTFSALPIASSTIPDVTSMGLRDALFLLESKGLKVSYDGYGRITAQSIKAGTQLVSGSSIHLTLSPF